jgi:thioredoxin-dependent peroxiredoxin
VLSILTFGSNIQKTHMALGTQLTVGEMAPAFSAQDETGAVRTLADFKGKNLILYFYPEDDTTVCTVQACNMSDGLDELRLAGYEVYGVSPDGVEKHQKFIEKYKLRQHLLADPDRLMMEAYGVYGEKLMYGKTVIGVHRTTFAINAEGRIAAIVTGVRSKIATQQVLKAVANR